MPRVVCSRVEGHIVHPQAIEQIRYKVGYILQSSWAHDYLPGIAYLLVKRALVLNYGPAKLRRFQIRVKPHPICSPGLREPSTRATSEHLFSNGLVVRQA